MESRDFSISLPPADVKTEQGTWDSVSGNSGRPIRQNQGIRDLGPWPSYPRYPGAFELRMIYASGAIKVTAGKYVR